MDSVGDWSFEEARHLVGPTIERLGRTCKHRPLIWVRSDMGYASSLNAHQGVKYESIILIWLRYVTFSHKHKEYCYDDIISVIKIVVACPGNT